jgi:hypothetical protein
VDQPQDPRRDPRGGRALTPPELRDLVADTLAVWEVAARPVVAEGAVVLAAPDGTALRISAATADDLPIRWWLEKPDQKRPCTSVTGLLRSLRNAVGAGEGMFSRVKVARGA